MCYFKKSKFHNLFFIIVMFTAPNSLFISHNHIQDERKVY
ncbi:unnamed protein product [Aphis gossypii]|uniref:Uncharacterized protein n=1 Tax=Aphis gossypii TaxID=80765 RepID=A0A9P0JF87_APHGO|nr:unnamed protein product [Aphis gossypii]